MATMRVSRNGEIILTPPQLPPFLSAVYDLKPIMGKPSDEEIKVLHAVIRSLNAVAHLPTLYNSELSMELSQHLFDAQMAVHRAKYSKSLLPGNASVYVPPALPPHIPGTLKQVVGAPSDEEIRSAQSIMRTLDNLANTPHLYDADLSMNLSQHIFNLQFARYMHDSEDGQFASESEPEQTHPVELLVDQQTQGDPTGVDAVLDCPGGEQNVTSVLEAKQIPQATSEFAQLGETMKDVKSILEKMSRMLTLIKADQAIVGCSEKYYQVFKNPVNQQGIAASECGLPLLRFEYHDNGWRYSIWMTSDHIARYLQFFNIGADLIQGGGEPKLIDGKNDEAKKLLLEQLGITRP
ncbi:hypothetical protein RSOLAG22IIIB_05729 [Rhizoctonia solani]|uniref:Uncharacterized protein n=1 Tax=Rhizoctonia solani TaxID=456999 RepID=A0A0K6G8Y3_9AGAM|nr:hypothetical protein RSOLAG22IIIB_05729 [Rhizoctonia solani]